MKSDFKIKYHLYLKSGKKYKCTSIVHNCFNGFEAQMKLDKILHERQKDISQIIIDDCIEHDAIIDFLKGFSKYEK